MKKEFLEKMKKSGKSKMSDMEQKALMKVFKDMSDEAGEAMSGKLMLKAESKEEAKALLDKAEDAVEEMPEGEGSEDSDEESFDDMEMDEEEEYDESEGDYMEEGMADFEETPEMEGSEDYSESDLEALDDEIERLMAKREKMKVATLKY